MKIKITFIYNSKTFVRNELLRVNESFEVKYSSKFSKINNSTNSLISSFAKESNSLNEYNELNPLPGKFEKEKLSINDIITIKDLEKKVFFVFNENYNDKNKVRSSNN